MCRIRFANGEETVNHAVQGIARATYLPMRVFGVGTGAELDRLVACVKRAVEPTEESVNVYAPTKVSLMSTGTAENDVQSDRSAFRSNGTLKAKSSTVTVFKSMCF